MTFDPGGGVFTTAMLIFPEIVPTVAVIVVVPTAIALTVPIEFTVATDCVSELQDALVVKFLVELSE